ncbi:asparagine synthase (glutamine-hydrolysing) [Blastococcus saxobsidens]|uniref:asparagine synthase (glutamine-hydrolyzing) n=1 Tax=Blastococcus saxobsidens TaxID=138336 RepID=A0A4Q7YB84_9ACTN|nr:asparagine synthase (glutamine-hydrolysing) [Blastococcus saxobsidens]
MCGIVGIAGTGATGDRADVRHMLRAAAAAISHRGPDGSGEWVAADRPIAFAHRRLAVIDLSDAASQPMLDPSGRTAVTFNGEIYNFRDLRTALEARGHAFRTSSDTEVLLTGCREWGVAGLAGRAVGMFAFAYADLDAGMLWLARDRFGEKPLYWYASEGTLAFASELKALVGMPGFSRDLDPAGVTDVIARGCVSQQRTIYRGVHQVQPGQVLGFRLSSAVVPADAAAITYWDAGAEARGARDDPFSGTFPEAVEAVDAELRRSVGRCTVSDVPVGAFLSGGVDSSLVTAILQAQAGASVKSFTIGFEDTRLNEARYASEVARALGTQHTSWTLGTADVLAVVPSLATMYDEPFGDSSQVATHLVARLAREQVTVALSGDGGDELFGGYNRHTLAPRLSRHLSRFPRPARALAARALRWPRVDWWDGLHRPGVDGTPTGSRGARVQKVASVLDFRDADDLYGRLTATAARGALIGAPAAAAALSRDLPLTSAIMLADVQGYLRDDILVKVDRAAMATSLETRMPLLDPAVYRLAWSLPQQYKVDGSRGKVVLRALLSEYLDPALFERPKMGFAMPVAEWLRGPLRPWAADLLAPQTLARTGLVDAEAVRSLWTDHLAGRADHAHALWHVLMLHAWLSRWA